MSKQLDRLDEVKAATARIGRLAEEKAEGTGVVTAVKNGTEQIVSFLAESDAPAPDRNCEARPDCAARRGT